MNPIRRIRGSSLIEVSVAATLTMGVMVSGLLIFVFGMSGVYKGQGRIDVESAAQEAIRRISYEIRESMSVTVDSNGMGVTYRKAVTDSNGNITTPVTWDNITRRIALSGTQIVLSTGTSYRVIAYNVITTDPLNGGAAYQIFTPSQGSITRALTIMVANQSTTSYSGVVTNRSRETIYLRNVPSITR